MDLATVIGMFGALSVVLWAIYLGGDFSIFLNIAGLLLVLGGSIFIVLSKFGVDHFFGAVKVAVKAFFLTIEKPNDLIKKTLQLANLARQNGVLALENTKIDNQFLKKGVQYLVDGFEPDVLRSLLSKEMHETQARHLQGQRIFRSLGEIAPAMGMIGTLVGLVQMLSAINDPQRIGPGMAVALLTTLYGAVLANVIAFPLAEKLAFRSQEEKQMKLLIIDALTGIQRGYNPRVIEDYLKIYLPVSERGTQKFKAKV